MSVPSVASGGQRREVLIITHHVRRDDPERGCDPGRGCVQGRVTQVGRNAAGQDAVPGLDEEEDDEPARRKDGEHKEQVQSVRVRSPVLPATQRGRAVSAGRLNVVRRSTPKSLRLLRAQNAWCAASHATYHRSFGCAWIRDNSMRLWVLRTCKSLSEMPIVLMSPSLMRRNPTPSTCDIHMYAVRSHSVKSCETAWAVKNWNQQIEIIQRAWAASSSEIPDAEPATLLSNRDFSAPGVSLSNPFSGE